MKFPNSPTTRIAVVLSALALVAAACGGSGSADEGESPSATTAAPRELAPPTPFVMFEGAQATLADFGGKPLVLNFWASWCPSCVAEMSAAFRPVEEELGDEITFLGMNIQDQRSLAEGLLDETGVEWVSAEDVAGDLYLALGGIAMPFTVFIDEDGGIVDKHNGPLTEGQLRDAIAEHFG